MDKKINRLANELAQLKTAAGAGKKKKRKKRSSPGQSGVSVPGGLSLPVSIGAGGRRRKRAGGNAGAGDICVTRTELLKAVSVDSTTAVGSFTGSVVLAPSSFSWLKNLSGSFENYRFNSLDIQWRSAVGTQRDGVVAYGVDWGFQNITWDRSKVVALTPVCDHPIWQSQSHMKLSAARMATRPWFTVGASGTDGAPGQLAYDVTVPKKTDNYMAGEFWVTYSVSFVGTR